MTTGPLEGTPAGLQWSDKPTHPLPAEIYAYWQSKKGGARMPPRAAIDPIEIPKLLPHLVIVDDLTEEGDFRIRLYGSELVFWTREERTGARSATLGASRREDLARMTQGRWQRVVQRVITERGPVFLRTRMTAHEKDYITVHAAALPLSDGRTGALTQIIGLLAYTMG